jgi:hypothetical protein
VTFDNIPAPLLYVGANQINAIVPFEVAGNSSTQIVATVNGAASVASQPVVAAAPGIFTVDLTGAGQAVVLNQDGTLNSSTNPAARGSVLTLWVTGMGILYAGQAPDMVAGVVQLNAGIPVGLQPWLTQVDFVLQVTTGNGPFDYIFANPVTIWLEALPS